MKFSSPERLTRSYQIAKYPSIVRDNENKFIVAWQDNRKFERFNIYAKRINADNSIVWDQKYFTNQHYDCVFPDIAVDQNNRSHIVYVGFRGDLGWTTKYDGDVLPDSIGWVAGGSGAGSFGSVSDGILSIAPYNVTGFWRYYSYNWAASYATGYRVDMKFKMEKLSSVYTDNSFVTLELKDGTRVFRVNFHHDRLSIQYAISPIRWYVYYHDFYEWSTIRVEKAAGTNVYGIYLNNILIKTITIPLSSSSNSIAFGYQTGYSGPPFPDPYNAIAKFDYVYFCTSGPILTGSSETSDLGYVSFDENGENASSTILNTATDYTNSYPIIQVGSDNKLYVSWQMSESGGYEVYVQRFNNDGSIDAGFPIPIKVSNAGVVAGAVRYPHDMVLDSDDNFYVVWNDNRVGADFVYGRKCDKDGVMLTAELLLQTIPIPGYAPRLVLDLSGRINVVWSGLSVNKYNIYFKRFASDFSYVGTDRDVTITSSYALYPDLFIDLEENIQIVWHEFAESSGYYVYFRALDKDLNIITHKKRLTWLPGDNRYPRIVNNSIEIASVEVQDSSGPPIKAQFVGYGLIGGIKRNNGDNIFVTENSDITITGQNTPVYVYRRADATTTTGTLIKTIAVGETIWTNVPPGYYFFRTPDAYASAGIFTLTYNVRDSKIVYHSDMGFAYNYEIYDIQSAAEGNVSCEFKRYLSASDTSFVWNAIALPEASSPAWTVTTTVGPDPVCVGGEMYNADLSIVSYRDWNIQTSLLPSILADSFDFKVEMKAGPGGGTSNQYSFYVSDGANFIMQIYLFDFGTYNLEMFFGYSGGYGDFLSLQTTTSITSNHIYTISFRRPNVEFLIDGVAIYTGIWDHIISEDYLVGDMLVSMEPGGSAMSGYVKSFKLEKSTTVTKFVPKIENASSYSSTIKY